MNPRSRTAYVSNLQYFVTGKQISDLFENLVDSVQSIGVYLDDKGFLIDQMTPENL